MRCVRRGVWRPSRSGAYLLAAALAATSLAAPTALREGAPRPRTRLATPLDELPEEVDLATVARYLHQLGYDHCQVDEAQRAVLVRVRGRNGVYDLYVLPRRSLVHFQVPGLFRFRGEDPGARRLQELLLELNWMNLLGKYSWDSRDGEVRFGYAHVSPGGLSFASFALALAQSLATVDEDLPRIRRVLKESQTGPGVAGKPAGAAGPQERNP